VPLARKGTLPWRTKGELDQLYPRPEALLSQSIATVWPAGCELAMGGRSLLSIPARRRWSPLAVPTGSRCRWGSHLAQWVQRPSPAVTSQVEPSPDDSHLMGHPHIGSPVPLVKGAAPPPGRLPTARGDRATWLRCQAMGETVGQAQAQLRNRRLELLSWGGNRRLCHLGPQSEE